ncbi:MAG: hypothetical protein QM813_07545 [Verrucomicrobiota bacterium]
MSDNTCFWRWAGIAAIGWASLVGSGRAAGETSACLEFSLATNTPAFAGLRVDSLGQGKFGPNAVVVRKHGPELWRLEQVGRTRWMYFAATNVMVGALWTIDFTDDRLTLRSRFVKESPSAPFELLIDQKLNHATLLGYQSPSEPAIKLPAVLHLPDQGSLWITGNGLPLRFESRRRQREVPANFVRVSFPAATEAQPVVEYTLTVAAIHPALSGLAENPRYDGFRRNFLNIFQWHPRLRTLANNSSSDVCGFVLYQYTEMAVRTPELAPGLTALDLVRLSVDRVLDGGLTYGQVGYKATAEYPEAAAWQGPYESLDHAPSILWAAARYALVMKDDAWAKQRYPQLLALTERMLSRDRNGNGLIEYEASGNSGSWPGKSQMRPANWWDTIGFGHEDAYANAIAYRALRMMAELATSLRQKADAQRFNAAADKLKASYVKELFNSKSGLIAGWKSADGQLHDYDFTFPSGMAVSLGLVEGQAARKMMETLWARFKEKGYTRFDLGLPGNLTPVRKADYIDHEPRFGGGTREDGSDNFQIYINGGATACHAYWTIKAFYQVGMVTEAREIFYPLLASYAAGNFQGRDEDGGSRDWKNWRGEGKGYEGFLVDGYLGLLAAEDDLRAKPTHAD